MSTTTPEPPPLPTVPDTTPAPVGQFGPASGIELSPAPQEAAPIDPQTAQGVTA